MQEIVQIENNEVMTTSRQIAEVFGKKHYHITRDIENAMAKVNESTQPDLGALKFEKYLYADSKGEMREAYKLNKNALVFVVMGYQTKRATDFKLAYINQFDLMEETLREQYSQQFFITEDAEQQAKRIKLENSTANTNSRTMNALYRWYKEAQKQGDMEMQEVMRAQVMEMYPGRKPTTTAIETTTVVPDTSEYYLTATNIANRLGSSVTPEEVGAIANVLGLGQHERVQTGSSLAKKFRYNESGFKAIQKYLREN